MPSSTCAFQLIIDANGFDMSKCNIDPKASIPIAMEMCLLHTNWTRILNDTTLFESFLDAPRSSFNRKWFDRKIVWIHASFESIRFSTARLHCAVQIRFCSYRCVYEFDRRKIIAGEIWHAPIETNQIRIFAVSYKFSTVRLSPVFFLSLSHYLLCFVWLCFE